MLVLLGGVMQVSATKTLYLKPSHSDWTNSENNERYALYVYGNGDAWIDFTLEKGLFKAEFDDKYTNMIICRMNGSNSTNVWENCWNQTEDLNWDQDNLLYEITGKNDKKYTVTTSSVTSHKIYVQVKDDTSTPYLYAWIGQRKMNGNWPGTTISTETVGVDNQTWYVYETLDPSPNFLFNKENSDTYKTANINTNFSSGDAFYFYYPNGSGDKYSPVARKTVSGTNIYATFSWTDGEDNNKGVNFSDLPANVNAYTLTVAGTSISKSAFTATLNKAKGLLLENNTGSDITLSLPIWNNGNEDATSNDLYANNATHISQDEAGFTKYILALQDNLVGFYKVNTTAGNDMGTNTAYLKVATSVGARASYWFDGETTGINALENLTNSQMDNNAPMYNLAGQRVNKSYKGVVVVNGKKMLNK